LDPANAAFQHLAAGQTTVVTVNYGVSDGTATTPAAVSWTVTGTIDAPTLAPNDALAASASVNEDGSVALNITPHFGNDDNATNTVTISGLGTATLDNTAHDVPPIVADSVTLTLAQLAGLTLHTADDDTASLTLSVQAHTTEGSSTADSATQTISLTVDPVSDTP